MEKRVQEDEGVLGLREELMKSILVRCNQIVTTEVPKASLNDLVDIDAKLGLVLSSVWERHHKQGDVWSKDIWNRDNAQRAIRELGYINIRPLENRIAALSHDINAMMKQ